MKRLLFILNPTAGDGNAGQHTELIQRHFGAYFDEVIVKETEKEGDATDFARQACRDRIDTVFCMGGDGTILETISGLAEQDFRPRFGVIPGGTYNGLARTLGMSMDAQEAIESMTFSHTRFIDIGKVNGGYFSFVLSVGKIPEAIHQVSSEEKTRLGMLGYARKVAQNALKPNKKTYAIHLPKRQFTLKASHLLVALSDELGDIKITDTSLVSGDGQANLIVYKEADLISHLRLLVDVLRRRTQHNRDVMIVPIQSARIELHRSLETVESDVDGDRGPDLPLDIAILKAHLEVYEGTVAAGTHQ